MVQNRNKLIDLFIGNAANSIVHKVLEIAIENSEIANKYNKELITSRDLAKKYREKINPKDSPLIERDIEYIKSRIINKIRAELLLRISNGYKNINLNLIDGFVDNFLKEMKIN